MDDITSLSITELQKKLASREVSSVELARAYLSKIEEKDSEIAAYLHVMQERALQDAARADEMLETGETYSSLLGIPIAIKDNMLIEGETCTSGSKILGNYTASYDATVIRKLKDAGAVLLGKTNMDEFAMGSSTENSAFGPTHNPHDVSRVPGGSSGGSAAAVAAGMCAASLGSDTGGSIRQPAAFCGVVGFKPSYGAVSRHGLMAMASSLDQIGPLALTAEDAHMVFDVIRGKDRFDSTSLDISSHEELPKPQTLRIGVPKEYFISGIDPVIEKSVREAIMRYQEMGASVEEISLPHTDYGLAAYYILMPSEVSSNLARYDGMRYGFSMLGPGESQNLSQIYNDSRRAGFGKEVRRRVMFGTYTLSAGYYDAYYIRAQKIRTLIIQDFQKAFEKVDVIMTPTTPNLPFKAGEKVADPVSMYLSDIFTVTVNLAGLPAVSLPCGWIEQGDGGATPKPLAKEGASRSEASAKDGKKLPVGLQIMGKLYHDDEVLSVAEWLHSS
ncbi:MAG: Asp-tRNA(Asn)/Glu-tRNA(Gln) amidotransferase subunit GatA [Candidatus Spechtbacteria bacterium]|nr:Asp-tRNA(Asn)/Glu-tRNA(Gln) amidotransferase subunit GatA [Candidatus Spechtbacteria bacterium]